jgi:hypothetical protein
MYFRGRWRTHIDKLMIFSFIYWYHGGGEKAMMGAGGLHYSFPGNFKEADTSKIGGR